MNRQPGARCAAATDAAALHDCGNGGLVFANLVDFDTLYGHRRDVSGCTEALEAFDAWLPTLLATLRAGDLLALSADHGCDPTAPGNDPTREYVPLLFAGDACPHVRGPRRTRQFQRPWGRRWRGT